MPPPSFSSLFPFLHSYSYYMEGGNPTPGGSRTPPGAPSSWLAAPPLDPLYTWAGGTPRHKLIHVIIFLAVCGAPFHHNPR